MHNATSNRRLGIADAAALGALLLIWTFQAGAQTPASQPVTSQSTTPQQVNPTYAASEADRQRLMDLLGIKALRMGPTSRNEVQPGRFGLVNYDESKANPYPNLPDPLALKNGKKVTSAKMWWAQRRPERLWKILTAKCTAACPK